MSLQFEIKLIIPGEWSSQKEEETSPTS